MTVRVVTWQGELTIAAKPAALGPQAPIDALFNGGDGGRYGLRASLKPR
jgi:hypothetical protein